MRYLILFSSFLFSCFSLLAQQSFTVSGKVNPKHNGKHVMLVSGKHIDTTIVQNGSFKLKGTLAEPGVALLRMGQLPPADLIRLYVSGPEIFVESNDSLKYAEVTGSRSTVEFNALRKQVDAAGKRRGVADSISYAFIASNPDSEISLFVLDQLVNGNFKQNMFYFEKLSPRLKSSEQGILLSHKLASAPSRRIGSKAPLFSGATPEGKTLSLAEVLNKHKYTFIDFWASWCGPCRAENPNVVKAYNTFKDKGFTVLSVSLDNDAEKWKKAIVTDGMPWYHVSTLKRWNDPVAAMYGVTAIPHNVLIDARGIVVATNLRGAALEDKLIELFK